MADANPTTMSTLEKHEVDLVSFGDAVVFRSKTRKGSEGLWAEWRPSKKLDPDEELVAKPEGMGDNVECFLKTQQSGTEKIPVMNLCVFQVDRYVVQAFGKQLQDLHQKISAEYALLTSR